MPDDFNGIPNIPTDSWLWRAFQYARIRSKLPDSAIFWTLMAYFGAALRDRVCIAWAPKTVFPNLPLLIVGPSGFGKTGATSVVEALFDGCLPLKIAEDATAEALVRDLAFDPYARGLYGNTCGLWVVPELADVFGKKDYQQGIVARLTRLLDNPLNRSVSRIGMQRPVTIPGYCVVSWIAGTTMDWMRLHVDEAVGAGGFLPRLLTINISEPPKFVPDPRSDADEIRSLNTELRTLFPPQHVPQERLDLNSTEWDATAKRIFDESNDSLWTDANAFAQRRAENVLRIYLILSHSAFSARFRTFPQPFFEAEKCAKWFEKQALTVYQELKTPHFRILSNQVFHRLSVKFPTGTSYTTFCKNARLSSRDLYATLIDLRDQGRIVWDGQKGDSLVKPVQEGATI